MAQVSATAQRLKSGWSHRSAAVGAILAMSFVVLTGAPAIPQPATANPPPTLQETGLYADPVTLQVDPAHLAFAPQYPLWSDGATKRRWISLPPGTAIDGSDPEAWIFPVGTRFWKEFSFNGEKVETRYLERRADGQWLYAAYAWSDDGREAQLVSARGKRGAYPLTGGRSHTIPGVTDCKACHQGGPSEILGFGTLQLSSERDAGAIHAELQPEPHVDLAYLVDRGLLVGLPKALRDASPRIAAATATERAALGYMHGNCGHCHNERGSLQNIALFLRHRAETTGDPALASTVAQPVRKPAPGQSPDAVLRVESGHPERSGLVQRVSSRSPALQMPPLGTELIDYEAVRLLYRWIEEKGASIQEAHANAEGR